MAIRLLHGADPVAAVRAERVPLLQAHTRDRSEREGHEEEAAQRFQQAQCSPKEE